MAKIEKSIEKSKQNIEIDDKEKDRLDNLYDLLSFVQSVKDLYIKKSKEDIRTEFYNHGVDITYTTHDKNGDIKKQETISIKFY